MLNLRVEKVKKKIRPSVVSGDGGGVVGAVGYMKTIYNMFVITHYAIIHCVCVMAVEGGKL